MKNLKYYMKLNYTIIIKKYDKHPGWEGYVAEVPELPGCSASGHTKEEALKNLEEAKSVWISGVMEDGLEVPEPRGEQDFRGKVLIRMPKSLHRELSLRATTENISLNQYILSLISIGLGNNQILVEIRQEIQKIKEEVHALKKELSTTMDESKMPSQEFSYKAGIDLLQAERPGTLRWVFKPIGSEWGEYFAPAISQGLGGKSKLIPIITEGFDKKELSEV